MRLLDRYILRQFTGTFLGLMLGLPLLFLIGDVTDKLDDYLSRGLTGGRVALSYLYMLPQFIFWSIPIAGLVATVFTIGNMTRHQEITAAKAGGVSFYRMAGPIILLSALLSVAAVGLGELIPTANARRSEVLGEKRFNNHISRTNFVFQANTGHTLSVRRLDTEAKQMVDLVMERDRTRRAPGVHILARRASWSERHGWVLFSGYIRLLDTTAVERTFQFDSLRIPAFTETPEELLADPKDPDEMRYAEMTRFIDAIHRTGGDTRKLRVDRAQRVTLPLALLVIVLFGAPLSTSSKRGGAAYGIGISLAVTMIYLTLFKVATAVGSSGSVDPILAAWGPNLLFLVAGLVLLTRVRT
jgi:lipopolysaccharide export system permease protein